jgi:protoheme IX farnesyltransferase
MSKLSHVLSEVTAHAPQDKSPDRRKVEHLKRSSNEVDGGSGADLGAATGMDYFMLLKPRVMSLVIFTGIIGAYLAPGTIHPFVFFVSILCIAVGAGASGAFNMWYDRDIDAIMGRTKSRPIPAGRMMPEDAVILATILAVGSITVLGLATNPLAAVLLAFTIFFYVVIYTMLLKRRTPQNIVIGGAAGAFPPMIGWAAVSNEISLESLLLFAIIFFWTPPHFWALALYRSQEYADARIPMMPVVSGIDETKTQILIYSVILVAVTMLPYAIQMCGLFYLANACALGTVFLYLSWKNKRNGTIADAKNLFWYSISYLFLLYFSMFLDKMMGGL